MIRFLLKLTIPSLIIFTAFSIAARALGTTQPPNPALAGFTEGCEGKPQPCWYGTILGKTPLEEVLSIFQQHGYSVTQDDFTGPEVVRSWTAKPLNNEDFCRIKFVTEPTWADTAVTKMDVVVIRFVLDNCKHLSRRFIFCTHSPSCGL